MRNSRYIAARTAASTWSNSASIDRISAHFASDRFWSAGVLAGWRAGGEDAA